MLRLTVLMVWLRSNCRKRLACGSQRRIEPRGRVKPKNVEYLESMFHSRDFPTAKRTRSDIIMTMMLGEFMLLSRFMHIIDL